MQDKDLAALKALAQAATPGPWESEHHRVFDSNGGSVAEFASTRGMYEPEHANRDYIAAANPAAILSLIYRIEQQAADQELAAKTIHALNARCEQQAARIAELEAALHVYAEPSNWRLDDNRIARLWHEPDSSTPDCYAGFEFATKVLNDIEAPVLFAAAQPSPAVDLSGLTRYGQKRTYMGGGHLTHGGMEQQESGEYVKLADVQSLLSSPVVREGKPDLTSLNEAQKRNVECMDSWAIIDALPTYSSLYTMAEQYSDMLREICFQHGAGGYNSEGLMPPDVANDKIRWIIEDTRRAVKASVEREVLATGKGDAPKPRSPLGKVAVSDERGYYVEWHMGIPAVGTELYAAPVATPSTPSQAWEGELPELPHHDRVFWQNGTNGVLELYRGDQMQDYARKAIGAAVAGVRDKALEEAAQACEVEVVENSGLLEQEAHNHAAKQCISHIRSLRPNPVSPAKVAGWISVEERLPEVGTWCNVLVDRELGDYFDRQGKSRFSVYGAQLREIDGEGYAYWQRWQMADGGPMGSLMNVSHWMPLPAAPHPVSQQDGEKGGA